MDKSIKKIVQPIGKEEINDEYDVKRHLLEIHTQELNDVLSEDLILCKLDEKQKKFITNNIMAAFEALTLITDPKTAIQCKNILMLPSQTVMNMERNRDDNFIAKLVTDGLAKDKETEEQEELDKQLIQKLQKKEK